MKQRILNLLIAVFTLVLLSGCHYDFPEGTKTTVHTHEEVTAYIQAYLNRDDVYVDTMTISGKDGYDRKYTHYYARVDDIDFVISSQVLCYGDSTGEFCEKRYGLHNNYNYKKIKALMQTTNQYTLTFDLDQKPIRICIYTISPIFIISYQSRMKMT